LVIFTVNGNHLTLKFQTMEIGGIMLKKKIVTTGLALALVFSALLPVSAEENKGSVLLKEQVNAKTQKILEENDIKLGTEVITEENGTIVEVTTRLATEEEFRNNAASKGAIPKLFPGASVEGELTPMYSQEDYWYGSGQNSLGSVWTNSLLVGLNAIGGRFQGEVYSHSPTVGVTSTPRVELETFGLVGGTIGLLKTYKYSKDYSSGTSTLGVAANVTGSVYLYYVNLYGDFKSGSTASTAIANIKKK
jgi:hypothetical protein